jgi:hypothetical protein
MSEQGDSIPTDKGDASMNPQTSISRMETDKTLLIDTQEQIRRRAFEIYELRGREDGHDLEDWLQAESEIGQRRAKAIGA